MQIRAFWQALFLRGQRVHTQWQWQDEEGAHSVKGQQSITLPIFICHPTPWVVCTMARVKLPSTLAAPSQCSACSCGECRVNSEGEGRE